MFEDHLLQRDKRKINQIEKKPINEKIGNIKTLSGVWGGWKSPFVFSFFSFFFCWTTEIFGDFGAQKKGSGFEFEEKIGEGKFLPSMHWG